MNNELGGVASEYLEITPEHIQTFGFNISTQIDPSLRNSKIWENLLDNDLWKTAPPDNLDELTLRPIFFPKT